MMLVFVLLSLGWLSYGSGWLLARSHGYVADPWEVSTTEGKLGTAGMTLFVLALILFFV